MEDVLADDLQADVPFLMVQEARLLELSPG
ncbi:hypothetical protein M878_05895 [Streptomyces roseochromogenus subsp. oscitans DS 12.976]|uniref:Uncharacterized protein n=1 Tax=Streptomyces roseochromogenus subsp. oscitans DS 12.976 TaxID=1352936 RepID=V6L2J1_STRRC|nr:hypothetical protein M878_05895 [Streptomyces roseochromogenus subsp. oscitans DS 12.976]